MPVVRDPVFTGDDADRQRKAYKKLQREIVAPKFAQQAKVAAKKKAERDHLESDRRELLRMKRENETELSRLERYVQGHATVEKRVLAEMEERREAISELGKAVADLDRALARPKPSADEMARARFRSEMTPRWEDWAFALKPTQRVVHAPVSVSLKGTTAPAALMANRKQQDAVLDKRRAIARTDVSRHECKADIRRKVARLAAAGAPDLKHGLRWPSGSNRVEDHEKTAAMFAWLFMPQLIAKLDAEIEQRPEGLSGDARAAKVATLNEELLHLQRIESRLVSMCLDEGYDVEQLPGHPLAWFEVEVRESKKDK